MRSDHEGVQFRHRLSRRHLLGLGSLGALGLTLPRLLQAEAKATLPERSMGTGGIHRPIRSCILIFHYGGPSHIDTFDMKPNAPAEIRANLARLLLACRACAYAST